MQQRVLALMHFGLREGGGATFLGNSETATGADDMFEQLDKRWRIFRRIGGTRHGTLDFPFPPPARHDRGAGGGEGRLPSRTSLAQLTNRVLLDQYTPAAVTINPQHQVVFFHGDTSPFLEHPRGEPTRELLAMARESVHHRLAHGDSPHHRQGKARLGSR